MGYQAAVDLGTTYTAAAIHRNGRVEVVWLGDRAAVIPSVVYVRPDGSVITGDAASRQGAVEPERVAREFKRRMGDRVTLIVGGMPFAAERLTARLLQAVMARIDEREGGPPDHLAITHPANWGPYKLDLLRQAVRQAGLDDLPVTYLTEPHAAAIHYATQERVEPGSVVAVYDLGGGTFDAAALRRTAEGGYELIGNPEGVEQLGGVDFDAAVLAHVDRALGGALSRLDPSDGAVAVALSRLRADCVEAKEVLSSDVDVAIPVAVSGTVTTVRLTRREFEDMIRPAIGDSIAAMRRALQSADVTPEDVQGVLLVGGSSRVPLVAQMVGAALGRPVAVDAHPKHGVALGAAVWAAQRAEATGAREVTVLPSDDDVSVRPPPAPSQPVAPPPTPQPPQRPQAHPQEPGRGGRRRLPVALAALGLVVVAGVLAVVLLAGDEPEGEVPPSAGAPLEDVWAATVGTEAVAVKLDPVSGEVLLNVSVTGGLVEEPVVTDRFVWIARDAPDTGAVVQQLERGDASFLRDIPLDVTDPEGVTVELMPSGEDGLWALVVPLTRRPVVARIDADGDIVTRTELSSATGSLEPVTDGEHLFVGTQRGVVRIDREGETLVGDLPAPAEAGGLAYAADRLFVIRNDATYELDPDTMTPVGPAAYQEAGGAVPLLEGAGDGRLQIEETYGGGTELSFLASGGQQAGSTFFTVDAASGDILVRSVIPGEMAAGTYDMRRTDPDQFWAYLQTPTPVLLSITGGGEVEEALEFAPRWDGDADLTLSGERLLASDARPGGDPVIYLINPDGPELEATVETFS